jgi:Protein of unknown function (DUF1153)
LRLKLRSFGLKWPKTHAQEGVNFGRRLTVRGGLLSLEDAYSRYTLTVEEFLSWQHSIEQHGLAGLRIKRIQQYRRQAAKAGQQIPRPVGRR